MGRFFKNHMLETSIVLTIIGLAGTALAWGVAYSTATWLDFYRNALRPVSEAVEGDVNLIVMIVAPIVLISGAWYLGEQILKRRRFERLLEGTGKRSEFVRNKRDLEDIARDLPDHYRERIKEKESNLRSAR